jgi:hypothetical protein
MKLAETGLAALLLAAAVASPSGAQEKNFNAYPDHVARYLIGEKLLNFLEVAERKPEWRAEVPLFIAKIKDIFEPWQIAEVSETPRRLGARTIRYRGIVGAAGANYNVLEGGLLRFGMLVLLLSPLLAAKVRGLMS